MITMKTIFTLLTLMSISSIAHAETVCKDYAAKGNVEITKLCAETTQSGVYQNLRFEANGSPWPIGPGINPANRAGRLCKVFEGVHASVSYEIKKGSSEQSTINLTGNYAFRGRLMDFDYIASITCH
jgi:hypothetical protein